MDEGELLKDEGELLKIEERRIKISEIDDSRGDLPKIIGVSKESFRAIEIKMAKEHSSYVKLIESLGLDAKQVISLVEQEILDKGIEINKSKTAVLVWKQKGVEEVTVKKFIGTVMLIEKISNSATGRMALLTKHFPGFGGIAA